MLRLIEAAYKVKEDAIAGGPGWVSSDLFDVIASGPEGMKMVEADQLLRSLLADRFTLVVARNASGAAICAHGGQGRVEAQAASGSGQGLPTGAAVGWGRTTCSGWGAAVLSTTI